MKQVFLIFLAFALSALLTFLVYVSVPRDYLSRGNDDGGVITIDKLFLSRPGYLYVVQNEYDFVADYQIHSVQSRLLEPGIYTNLSFGEIFLVKANTFSKYELSIFHDDGDYFFDIQKDKKVDKSF